jgi:hypothetical protein
MSLITPFDGIEPSKLPVDEKLLETKSNGFSKKKFNRQFSNQVKKQIS